MRRVELWILVAGLTALTLGLAGPGIGRGAFQGTGTELVVLAAVGSPFASLASEIAQAEGAPQVEDWASALSLAPRYVLWVAAAGELSDQGMVAAGLALKRNGEIPAVGLITGGTMSEARALWQRAGLARPGRVYAVNAEYPTAGVLKGQIWEATGQDSVPLERETLAAALREAGYLSFTGHGSARYLRIDEETTFITADLPDLPPLVVGTASCQTLRPWEKGSIALGFVSRGAAAYAGFVYSPLEGYLIGEFRDLPFRYTFPGFPVGMVVALQNIGVMQGFAAFPFYFLVGDPRVPLQAGPPYQQLDEETVRGARTLSAADAPPGLIPVRVVGGARYRFVEVTGVGAAAEGDRFYNARIQTARLGNDRYIVFVHPGGAFSIRLSERPPWFWPVTRALTAAFDHVILFTPQNGGDGIILAVGGMALAVALAGMWKARSRLNGRRILAAAAIFGLLAAVGQGLYGSARLPLAAISSKPLALSGLWLVGVSLLAAAGAVFYLSARRWPGRLLGLLAAIFPALAPGFFALGAVGLLNMAIAAKEPGLGVYNLNLGLLGMIAAGLEALLFALAFRLTGRMGCCKDPR